MFAQFLRVQSKYKRFHSYWDYHVVDSVLVMAL